VGVCR